MASDPLPELVFGLVGPIGTNLSSVQESLTNSLMKVSYKVEPVHLVEDLKEFDRFSYIRDKPIFDRYTTRIQAGNEFRKIMNMNDALALLGVSSILKFRIESNSRLYPSLSKEELKARPVPGTAYIFRSLKRPEETETLRKIYGRSFVLIAVYMPRQSRVQYLADKESRSHDMVGIDKDTIARSENLIRVDENEENNPYGQRIQELFPKADFFVDGRDPRKLEPTLDRFVQLLFENTYRTPFKDEQGLFFAQAASLRSSDLSRQVGAVITSPGGDILAVGCNEVPSPDGGQYWPETTGERRDFQLGYSSNEFKQREMVKDLLERLREHHLLNPLYKDLTIDRLTHKAYSVLKGSRARSLIEFSRVVHAEMACLTTAARRGIPVEGGIFYCTTFPCHECARHIVASGIQRVVYVEPYPKSLADELFSDSIAIDPVEPPPNKVVFQPFVGVSPRLYQDLFAKGKRKDTKGKTIPWLASKARPRFSEDVRRYIQMEGLLCEGLRARIRKIGLAERTLFD